MNYFKDKKNIVIVVIVILIIAVIVLLIFSLKKTKPIGTTDINSETFKGQIINDTVKIPDTLKITNRDGELVSRGQYNIKLQPQSETEQAFISNAKLTLKFAYELASPEAIKWSPDSKLVFIKSNGALGLEGKASSWQLVFGSAKNKKTYEIIISGDKIISTKEINSALSGYSLPNNWYDSYEAIASLRNLPQFSNDTVSAINFYYSVPNNSWAYALANGEKTTSMWVK